MSTMLLTTLDACVHPRRGDVHNASASILSVVIVLVLRRVASTAAGTLQHSLWMRRR
jgi:hypothetical protein